MSSGKDWDLEGAPSPQNEAEYRAVLRATVESFEALLLETSWSKVPYEDATIQLWEYVLPSSSSAPSVAKVSASSSRPASLPSSTSLDSLHAKKSKITLLKSQGIVDCPAGKLAALIHSENEADVKKFENDLISTRTIKKIDDQSNIYYRKYQTPAVLDNRDFISLGTLVNREDGSFIRVATSINYPGIPVPSGFLRGRIIITGFHLIPLGEKTLVVRISQVDPRGGVPKFLVNTFKKKTAGYINLLRNAVKPPK